LFHLDSRSSLLSQTVTAVCTAQVPDVVYR